MAKRNKNKLLNSTNSTYENDLKNIYNIKIKCKNNKQKQFLNILKNPKKEICFGIGSAGSGKSYISLSFALQALTKGIKYTKIIIIVPTVEAGNMNIGYLKGTLEEKIAPYIDADTYTMEKILLNSGFENAKQIIKDLIKNGQIQYELVNFARGKTFDNCIILINEAENYTKEEMLLLLTRIGENCKIICTGDEKQTDRKDIKKSNSECGLIYASNALKSLDEIETVIFDNNDIVRNPLILKILNAY